MGAGQGISPARTADGLSFMDRERWLQVDRILEAVLDLPADDRSAFLTGACAGDEQLLTEVQALVAAHDQQDVFLERSGWSDGIRLLAGDDASTVIRETLGDYRIVRRLGTGGVSEVYLAVDSRLSRPVAIKLLAPCWAADHDSMQRFRQEALAASALNHPNILTIYEIKEWHGRNFIVTEFVDGLTLRGYLEAKRPQISVSLEIVLQIASALVAAHSAGIIHCDIKPENVMVRPDGLVKVLDFGIAKREKPGSTSSFEHHPPTATGVVIGTVAYMSPEQARGQIVDAGTDIWSLGVVLYEMIAGRLPFSGATHTDRIAAILECEPAPLRTVRQDAPVELETIISRALAKDRSERYRDVVAFAEELRKVQDDLKESGSRTLRTPRRMLAGTFMLLAGFTVALAGYWHSYYGDYGRNQNSGVQASERISSLAVLPLVNGGGSSDTEYLADGITDSLINDLSEIPQLRIMSRNSVFPYKGHIIDVRKVGKTLRVQAVLTGSLVWRGDRIILTVELADARNSRHIWGDQYERQLVNIPSLQHDIARQITESLRLKLSAEQKNRLARVDTSNPEAYLSYLKGLFYWLKLAPEDFRKSRSYFEQAIEADPGYALAYCGLGNYYGFASAQGLMDPEEGWPKAEAGISKALELDPRLPEARHGRAAIQWIYRRDWAGAETEFRTAIQLNANDAEAHNHYAFFLLAKGRFDEAISELRDALILDPLSTRYISHLGQAYYFARRSNEAIGQYRQALELDPKDALVHEWLGDAYQRVGDEPGALAEWRTALTLTGESVVAKRISDISSTRGFAAAVRALARSKLERWIRQKKRGEFVPAIDYARAYISLNQAEKGIEWLEKASRERNRFVFFLNTDPFYDPLRGDARFDAIARSVGAPN
jgi:serine/threonine protein kinase/Tfp pilus assembly protein PilF